MYVCMYVCMHVCMYVCTYRYVCTYVCMYVVCMNAYDSTFGPNVSLWLVTYYVTFNHACHIHGTFTSQLHISGHVQTKLDIHTCIHTYIQLPRTTTDIFRFSDLRWERNVRNRARASATTVSFLKQCFFVVGVILCKFR